MKNSSTILIRVAIFMLLGISFCVYKIQNHDTTAQVGVIMPAEPTIIPTPPELVAVETNNTNGSVSVTGSVRAEFEK